MPKAAVFTMKLKLESKLRAEFMAEAEAAHRPASQVLREFFRRQRESREYEEFLGRKVDAGRTSMRAGVGHTNDEVESTFAARRTAATNQA